jgi:hypothetical protein
MLKLGSPLLILILILILGLVLGLLLGLGCAGSPPPRPVDPAATLARAIEAEEADRGQEAAWLARGRIQWEVEGYRGRGRLRFLSSAGRVRVDLQPSGAFGLGPGSATLWADSADMVWREGGSEPGDAAESRLFTPILGESATARELDLLVFGLGRLPDRWPNPPREALVDGDEVRLTAVLADGVEEEIWIRGEPPVLVRLEQRDQKGNLRFRATFDRHQAANGLRVARLLRLEAPRQGDRLRVDWDEVAPADAASLEGLTRPEAGGESGPVP